MTPTSTDRAHKISPLDVFGAISHLSAAGGESSQSFEALLNTSQSSTNQASSGRSEQQRRDDRPERELDTPQKYVPNAVEPLSRNKPPDEIHPTDEQERKHDDLEAEERDAADQISGTAASTTQTLPPPEQAKVRESGTSDVRTRPEHPASDEKLIDPGNVPPTVAIASQLPNSAPPFSASAEPSKADPQAVAVGANVNPPGLSKPDSPSVAPEAAGDAALPTRDYAAAVHGNGPLSLTEPDQSSLNVIDAIATIDGQTATAVVEVQPVEQSNNGSDRKGDSNQHEEPLQHATDTPIMQTASPDVTSNQETQNAAVPTPTTNVAPPSAQDASQLRPNTLPPTGGVQPPPHRLPQNVLTRSEGRRGHNPAPVPIDSARFLSRVAKAFLSAQQRDGEVRLRLSPPELGSLRLQVSVQDGVMVARMETETEAARTSLTNNLPALRERLAEQGIRVERFDIDLMQRPTTGTPDRPSDPQQQPEPPPLRLPRPNQANSEGPAAPTTINNWNGQGRLNVII